MKNTPYSDANFFRGFLINLHNNAAKEILMELLLFGITREIAGSNILQVPEPAQIKTVGMLRNWLVTNLPEMEKLQSLAIAVNGEYASDETPLNVGNEIALIPPVSGG